MIKVADEIWLATSLLHWENPKREDFSVTEIIQRAMKENLAEGYRPGLPMHASSHCVATKSPNPAVHRMLSETGRGKRRLFRPGDKFHPDRKRGKTHPEADDLPPKYRYLLEWYKHEYTQRNGEEDLPRGASLEDLLRFAGQISRGDVKKMKAAIEEGCERIDPDEWQIPAGH